MAKKKDKTFMVCWNRYCSIDIKAKDETEAREKFEQMLSDNDPQIQAMLEGAHEEIDIEDCD